MIHPTDEEFAAFLEEMVAIGLLELTGKRCRDSKGALVPEYRRTAKRLSPEQKDMFLSRHGEGYHG